MGIAAEILMELSLLIAGTDWNCALSGDCHQENGQ
jgi:hypothetical protein